MTCDIVHAGTNLTLVRQRIAAEGATKTLASVLRKCQMCKCQNGECNGEKESQGLGHLR